jgi:hypothetical protein
MKTAADIQDFLIKLELPYEEPREGTFVIQGHDGLDTIVITLAGPVLVFRVKLMEVPRARPGSDREELFRTLLELNATEMMHGAYGVEGDSVVICDALQLENLDFNEFAATIDDISLAVASHMGRLAKFREAA